MPMAANIDIIWHGIRRLSLQFLARGFFLFYVYISGRGLARGRRHVSRAYCRPPHNQ